MITIILSILPILLCWCIYRYIRWIILRFHMYACLRRTASNISARFTVKNALWLFARNGDGNISFIIETDSTVYYIHVCGALRLRCSYIFVNESSWILRQYGILGRGQIYSDKMISVRPTVLPEDLITIKQEQIIYLFSPAPLGCGTAIQGLNSVLPCSPGQNIPGGILHNTKSFCSQLLYNLKNEACENAYIS